MTVTDDTTEAGKASGGGRRHVSQSQRSNLRQQLLGLIERYALVFFFAITLVFFSLWSRTSGTFATLKNFQYVLGNQAPNGILALAIIIPLVCGEFDFSVGVIAGASALLVAGFMSNLGAPLLVAVIVAIGAGALVGLNNGNLVARIGVNSLIVTLGTATVLVGFNNWYSKGQTFLNGISRNLTNLGSGNWLGIPRPLFFLVVVALGVYYLLEHTPYGRYLHSIGSNRDAARLVGLPVERFVLLAFIISGALAGIAGVLLVSRAGSAGPTSSTLFDSIGALSAAYLGATAIKPGRFNVAGTLIAIFFLKFTLSGLNAAGYNGWVTDVFNGSALTAAVIVATVIGRKRAASY